jgi:hypothetical protein
MTSQQSPVVSAPSDPSVDFLAALDARAILNAAVSRGRTHIVELLVHALPPDLDALSLDGSGLQHEVDGILQCLRVLLDPCRAACPALSTFEARNYSSASFSSSSALAILGCLPVDRARIKTLTLRKFQVDDNVLQFCCENFPSLTCLDVGDNDALHNVPFAVKLLTKLTSLSLDNCSNLMSLPDELLILQPTLKRINTEGCLSVTFPPPSVLKDGLTSIFDFLKKAQDAEPLKRVKVLFLGNGRSGKTSLLRALAEQPLQPGDAGPDSTVGLSVDTLQQQLKLGFLEKTFERLPEITYWDFAGQLEYSAAHDFFLSSRQAVYVIIFSVMEDRDSQMHQVACVPAAAENRRFFVLRDVFEQVLAAHCSHARAAARTLPDRGHQGRSRGRQLERRAGEAS